jgi:integrase
LKAAGLRGIRFHDLRHVFASTAITLLDPIAVQSYCGHVHFSTRQRYLHHKPRPREAQALHEAFGGTVSLSVSRNGAVSDELSATERT